MANEKLDKGDIWKKWEEKWTSNPTENIKDTFKTTFENVYTETKNKIDSNQKSNFEIKRKFSNVFLISSCASAVLLLFIVYVKLFLLFQNLFPLNILKVITNPLFFLTLFAIGCLTGMIFIYTYKNIREKDSKAYDVTVINTDKIADHNTYDVTVIKNSDETSSNTYHLTVSNTEDARNKMIRNIKKTGKFFGIIFVIVVVSLYNYQFSITIAQQINLHHLIILASIAVISILLYLLYLGRKADVDKYQETWARHSHTLYQYQRVMMYYILDLPLKELNSEFEFSTLNNDQIFMLIILQIMNGNINKFVNNMETKEETLTATVDKLLSTLKTK